jgi:alpha-1,3-glucan synthase
LIECDDWTCIINHVAPGADRLRFSFNYGQSWSAWQDYEINTSLNRNDINATSPFWEGIHCIVQYWSDLAQSSNAVVHGDAEYTGPERRQPRYLVRSQLNKWGVDRGRTVTMENGGAIDGWHSPVKLI